MDLSGHRRFSHYAQKLNIHLATIHRWHRRGIRGEHPKAVKIGCVWHTTDADVAAFIKAINEPASKPSGNSSARQALGV